MSNYVALSIIIISIALTIIIQIKLKKGELKPAKIYSYKSVINVYFMSLCVILITCLIIYSFTTSLKLTISTGVILLCLVGVGALRALLIEYQIKRRGGRKRGNSEFR